MNWTGEVEDATILEDLITSAFVRKCHACIRGLGLQNCDWTLENIVQSTSKGQLPQKKEKQKLRRFLTERQIAWMIYMCRSDSHTLLRRLDESRTERKRAAIQTKCDEDLLAMREMPKDNLLDCLNKRLV